MTSLKYLLVALLALSLRLHLPAVDMDQSSLLRWGIENSAPGAIKQLASDVKSGKRTDLNSAMLKHIMGVSPADRMVECVDVIQGRWKDAETGADRSSEVTIEDKLRAWDDLEMVRSFLVETGRIEKSADARPGS